MNKKAVILLSGGLDSLLTLAIAISENYEPFPLHLNYGQITQQRELQAFNDILEHYKIENKLIVDIEYLKKIGGSSLTVVGAMPCACPNENERGQPQEIDPTVLRSPNEIAEQARNDGNSRGNSDLNNTKNNSTPNSYVPFRNANILAIATSWAEVISANAIFIGASEVDFSGYPDCRRIFFDAFEETINLGTKPETSITVETPLIKMTKEDVVREGAKLKIPFELSWSCYFENEVACGVCESCKLRLNGFRNAKIKDPIQYSHST